MASKRCSNDGRFMRNLTDGGKWWTCTCGRIDSTDPEVQGGLELMGLFRGQRNG